MGPPPPRTYYAYTLGFQGFTQRATVEDQAADGTLTSLTGFQHPGFMIYGLYHFAPKRSLGLKARSIEYDWTEKITAESLQWSETEASFFANFGWATLSVDHFQSAKILRPLPQQQSVQDIELLGASLGMQQRFLKVFQGSTSVGYASGGDTSQTHWQLELTAFWPWSSTLSLETGVSFRRVLRQGGGLSHHAQEMRFFIGTPLKFGLRQE